MSKVRYNGVSDALQGRMGVVVFRRVLGRLYASNRPNESTKPPSADQIAQPSTSPRRPGMQRTTCAIPKSGRCMNASRWTARRRRSVPR